VAIGDWALGAVAIGRSALGVVAIGEHGFVLVPIIGDVFRWFKGRFG